MGEEEKRCGRLKEHEHALPSRHPNSDPIPTTRPYSRLACGGEISLGRGTKDIRAVLSRRTVLRAVHPAYIPHTPCPVLRADYMRRRLCHRGLHQASANPGRRHWLPGHAASVDTLTSTVLSPDAARRLCNPGDAA
jgi:hypothetical protein